MAVTLGSWALCRRLLTIAPSLQNCGSETGAPTNVDLVQDRSRVEASLCLLTLLKVMTRRGRDLPFSTFDGTLIDVMSLQTVTPEHLPPTTSPAGAAKLIFLTTTPSTGAVPFRNTYKECDSRL
jgi:hypothetical protein